MSGLPRTGVRFGAESCQLSPEYAPKGFPVTFSSELAIKRPILEFINVWHPLVRLAYYTFSQSSQSDPESRMVRFRIPANQRYPKGRYFFFLFCISTLSILTTDELIAVVVNEEGQTDNELSDNLLNILQLNLSEESEQVSIKIDEEMLTKYKNIALDYMAELRQQKESSAKKRNDGLIATRRSALEKTYQAKKNRALSRLSSATDERIIRMHEGEVRNLQSKLEAAIEDVESKKNVSVTYEPVSFGLVEISD